MERTLVSDIHARTRPSPYTNNASGVVREKVDILFGKTVDNKTRTELCTLIYYPEMKMKDMKKTTEDMREWYMITLYRLIEVCRLCSSKYTRSKVRKALPKDFEYILDELLNTSNESQNKQDYYEKIISTIIDIDRADSFIIALASVIKRMVGGQAACGGRCFRPRAACRCDTGQADVPPFRGYTVGQPRRAVDGRGLGQRGVHSGSAQHKHKIRQYRFCGKRLRHKPQAAGALCAGDVYRRYRRRGPYAQGNSHNTVQAGRRDNKAQVGIRYGRQAAAGKDKLR